MAWRLIDAPELTGVWISHIARLGSEFIVAGTAGTGFDSGGVVARSQDATTWDVHSLSPRNVRVVGCASDGRTLVIAGAVGRPGAASAEWRSWSTTDGSVWRESHNTAGQISAVHAAGGQFFAFDTSRLLWGVSSVWRSAEGEHWTPSTTHPEGALFRVHAVANLGERTLAVGKREPITDGPIREVIWASDDDGQSWVDLSDGLHDDPYGSLDDLAAVDDSFVAANSSAYTLLVPRTSRIIGSADGATWTVRSDEAAFGDAVVHQVLVPMGTHWLAFGLADARGCAWTSSDGRTWQELPPLPWVNGTRSIRGEAGPGGILVLMGGRLWWASPEW